MISMLPFNKMKNVKVLEIVDPTKPIITPDLRKDLWKKRAETMVNKLKEVGASTWAAPVLLTILLGYGVYSASRAETRANEQAIAIQSLRDSMIRLQTQKEDQEKIMERDRHDQMVALDKEATWREMMNVKINSLANQVNGNKINNHANPAN